MAAFPGLEEPSKNEDKLMVGREGSKRGKCEMELARSLDNKRPMTCETHVLQRQKGCGHLHNNALKQTT